VSRKRQPIANIDPVCIECGKMGALVTGQRIYPHLPHLHAKPYFRCECGAYVGCHPRTEIPLGYPAGPLTRRARNHAHEVFDRLWLVKSEREKISKSEARAAGYTWLATALGIDPKDCHISHFDAKTCARVVLACQPRRTTDDQA
jgi:hypothetical protein